MVEIRKNKVKKITPPFEISNTFASKKAYPMSSNKKECPSCAMEVDNDSKICPICSYEFPKQNPIYQWVAILVVIVFLLTMLL
jgi:RNA polymerase subunit RPABC4/transcription elongation factor Spt4